MTTSSGEERGPTRTLTVNADLVGGIVMAVFGTIGLAAATGGTFNIWVFPRFNSVVVLLMSAGLIVKGIARSSRDEFLDRRAAVTMVLPFAAGFVAFFFLFTRLGFIATTILLYGAATYVLRRKRGFWTLVTSLALGAVLTMILYSVLKGVFYVPFPEGTWWEALLE